MGPDRELLGVGDWLPPADSAAGRLSRRQLLQRSALALGGIAGLGLFDPSAVFGSALSAPRPIPGGLSLTTFTFVPTGADLHFFSPAIGSEMSTITDFNGVVAGSETQGTAQGSDGTQYSFDCDMRFMRGAYVGLDGRMHNGSFGFI
jgi:hypothetical protein